MGRQCQQSWGHSGGNSRTCRGMHAHLSHTGWGGGGVGVGGWVGGGGGGHLTDDSDFIKIWLDSFRRHSVAKELQLFHEEFTFR